jgi:hypothetical protein
MWRLENFLRSVPTNRQQGDYDIWDPYLGPKQDKDYLWVNNANMLDISEHRMDLSAPNLGFKI